MAKSDQDDVLDVLRGVVDGVKAGTVFGTPVSHEGLTVLPVARIGGGMGGGRGDGRNGRGAEGSGGGFGLSARPVGVYVIGDGKVSWSPAVDVTRIALGGQLVGIVALLTLRTLFKMIRDRQRQALQAAADANPPEEPSPNGHTEVPTASRKLRAVRRSRRSRA